MFPGKIIIGSRGSTLALWQANWTKEIILKQYPSAEATIQIIKTHGDKILDVALSKIGDKGLFTKALEDALLENKIDIAVHSLKDIPTILPGELGISFVSKREDPRDVFISFKYNSLDELPYGASVATGSLRRKCQLLSYRNDFNIIDVRGNIETRLKKLKENEWDGMILAQAGVTRLGLEGYIKQVIPEDIILPAVGQGVIAAETRNSDNDLNNMLGELSDKQVMYQVIAERSFLKIMEGGCQVPVGTFSEIKGDEITLHAMIGSLDGKKVIKNNMKDSISKAEDLGRRLGKDLLERGGRKILESIRTN